MKAILCACAIAAAGVTQAQAADLDHASAYETFQMFKADLLEQGVLTYELHERAPTDRRETVFKEARVQKDIRFDAASCTVTIAQEFRRNGKLWFSGVIEFPLRDASGFQTSSAAVFGKGSQPPRLDIEDVGAPPEQRPPRKAYSVSPDIVVASLTGGDGSLGHIFYRDERAATRSTQMLSHLSRVC
jgi:hypothetical protein